MIAFNAFKPVKSSNLSTLVAPAVSGKMKKKLGKMGVQLKIEALPVQSNTNKLTHFLCGSDILKDGGHDVPLKGDEDYPSWLWALHVGKPRALDEMDINSKQYWIKVRKMANVQYKKLDKLRRH